MDGTLVDFIGGVEQFLDLNFPDLQWSRDDFITWDLFSNLGSKEAEQAAIDYMRSPGFFRNLQPVPKAMDALLELQDAGHTVKICTTPLRGAAREQSKQDKLFWITDYLGNTFAQKTIFSDDKTKEPADVLIDDNPSLTVHASQIAFTDWVMPEHPYNKTLPECEQLPTARVKSDWSDWQEVFNKLKLL